ncbi:MAG: oxidoreductase [Deltaproteobacteria bacterium]|nr:oxidoreductase [Deltaproteobacteria bacterium]
MKKWNMIIDVKNCEDCNCCFLACKDEHVDNDFPPHSSSQPTHIHRWINIMRKERGQFPLIDVAYLPIPCMHCDNAPCIKNAADNAVYKRNDGIVIIDPIQSKGQKDLVKSCPYGAIWWNDEKEIPQKCTFCAHLLDDGWQKSRCVQACPTGALRMLHVEDSEMEKVIQDERLEVLHPEYQTKPRVYYKNLYRYFKCFIAGSIALKHDGIEDCVEGASVALYHNGEKLSVTKTDKFGDFKFDKLEPDSGLYKISVESAELEKKIIEIDLKESCNVGTILLHKR